MTIIPAVLSVVTLGAAASYGFNRYRKMKSELPDDREVRPEDKIANPQNLSTFDKNPNVGGRATAPVGK